MSKLVADLSVNLGVMAILLCTLDIEGKRYYRTANTMTLHTIVWIQIDGASCEKGQDFL